MNEKECLSIKYLKKECDLNKLWSIHIELFQTLKSRNI